MSQFEAGTHDALVRLGATTAAAIAQVLEALAPGIVQRGEVSVLSKAASPFEDLGPGSVATSVSFTGRLTGSIVFVLSAAAADALAGASAGEEMMSAAADALGVVLGQEVETSDTETRILDDGEPALDVHGAGAHVTTTTFLVAGEPCLLVQFVAGDSLVQVVGSDSLPQLGHASAEIDSEDTISLESALGHISLRVWVELGRARIPLGRALALPVGAVVDLDRAADAPVDLFVNGLRLGKGHLLVTDDGEWAIHLDDVGNWNRLSAGPVPAYAQPL